jgi:hypothetical protein
MPRIGMDHSVLYFFSASPEMFSGEWASLQELPDLGYQLSLRHGAAQPGSLARNRLPRAMTIDGRPSTTQIQLTGSRP